MVAIGDDLNEAPCGFLEYSKSGIITNINQTFIDLLSCTDRSEVIGTAIESLFTTAGKIFYQTHFYPLVMLHGKASEIFFTLKSRDGKRISAICNATLKTKAEGEVIQCIFIPVPERSKYEQELLIARRNAESALQESKNMIAVIADLERSNFALDQKVSQLKQIDDDIAQFSKSISHDLQEPIRKIAMFADKLASQAVDILPADGIRDLNKINLECRNLRSLIDYLERFISLNTVNEQITSLSLNKILEKTIRLGVAKLDEVNIEFHADDLPAIDGYPLQIAALFYNLIDNSIKFSAKERPLKIKVSGTIVEQNTYRTLKEKYRYAQFVKIVIQDNGKGFLSEDQKQIFRLQKKAIHTGVNLGFGLALAKKITDNHRGTISISSEIDKGTAVTILLPLVHSNAL